MKTVPINIVLLVCLISGIFGYYFGKTLTYKTFSKDKIYISTKAKEMREYDKKKESEKEEQLAIQNIKYIYEMKKKYNL